MRFKTRLGVVLAAFACATGASAQGNPVDVVEYYHAGFDHYFISSLTGDIDALDSGALKGWSRTGQGFKAYDAPAAGTSPVCRFYLPPASGDSHFYSASPAECAEVAAKFPAFSYESPSVMHVGLPDAATGACSPGWTPVYRLWNQRADSNHRYTTDRGLRTQMLAQGYVAEGYGPDGVAMCSPGTNGTFDLSLSTPELLLMPGDVREVYVVVAPMGGFAGDVALSVSGMPAGIAGQLSATTLSVGPQTWAAKLRLTASGSAAGAAGAVTVVAQSGDASVSTTLAIAITQPGDPVAVRLRAIADVEDKSRELARQGLDAAGLVQGIAAFMTAHPQYEEAGFDLDYESAWGRQKDGTLHVVAGGRTAASANATHAGKHPTPKSGSDVEVTVPYALLLQSRLSNGSAAAAAQMGKYLSGRGWHVQQPVGASVNALANAKNVGFLYLDGSGGRAWPKGVTDPNAALFGVQTDTLVTPSREVEFNVERQAGRLIALQNFYGVTVTTSGPAGTYQEQVAGTWYAITERFVDKYMSFQPDSVVWINASNSSSHSSFVNAFHAKKAAVYLGWDTRFTGAEGAAHKAATYFVDRMVGANAHPIKETPPQRPFPYDLVLSDMRGKGLDRAGLASLVVSTGAGLANRPIFAPSIQFVTVDEWEGLLTLTGEFGSNPTPKVTVGGTEVGVKQSSKSKIVANLYYDGPGSSGDVVVEVAGVKSNARQLTDWVIPLNYDFLDFPYKGNRVNGKGQVRFRADVGGYRLVPAEKPRYILRGGVSHRDTWLDVIASGVHVTESACKIEASGADTYVSRTTPYTALDTQLHAYLRSDTEQLRGAIGLAFGGLGSTIVTLLAGVDRFGKPCATGSFPIMFAFGQLDNTTQFPADQSESPQLLPYPAIPFAFSKSFDVPATTFKAGKEDIGNITVSWPAVTPDAPPRDTPDAGK